MDVNWAVSRALSLVAKMDLNWTLKFKALMPPFLVGFVLGNIVGSELGSAVGFKLGGIEGSELGSVDGSKLGNIKCSELSKVDRSKLGKLFLNWI